MRVALTGGIASGKTTVSDRWAELGAVIVDSDVLAREVVERGTPGLAAVAERFGRDVLAADGTLDRKALAGKVFGDDAARQDLEGILHPLIRARGAELEESAPADALVVHVIPLLVEVGRVGEFDTIVVVDVPEDVQLKRAMSRDGATSEQVRARIAAQASREQRLEVATHVIDNSADLAHLVAEADRVWAVLNGDSPAPCE
ncbi:dephospho-CoA kinase [Granulicoccus sp. GXG6511]|uniref:dephospho-CoA kinase n=1 Tax=Granulicoccus sp. GXG6511 TaxID=3381351 RepID=UPI003D7D1D5A